MGKTKTALLTGVTGQDGSYLAELLLSKGYEVHGLVRRVAIEDADLRYARIKHILNDITLHSGSVESYQSVFNIVHSVMPDEVYHLAAQSFVSESFADEFSTMKVNAEGTHGILSCCRTVVPDCRFYFAGSSEMFGEVLQTPQTEETPFNPRSIYGISKCAGFNLTKHYRTAYGMHASSGILFNHEGPRRGHEFVTRKISRHAAKIKLGMAKTLPLGNVNAVRDWGHAQDYVEAQWLMLQQDKPDDYVVATGVTHTVHDFCKKAFALLGLKCDDYITVDEKFKRPSDVNLLLGDATKARKILGWKPKISFDDMVAEMVRTDYDELAVRRSKSAR